MNWTEQKKDLGFWPPCASLFHLCVCKTECDVSADREDKWEHWPAVLKHKLRIQSQRDTEIHRSATDAKGQRVAVAARPRAQERERERERKEEKRGDVFPN